MKILIADDHMLFKDGLELNITQQFPAAKIFFSNDYTSTLEQIRKNKDIELVLLDLDMPDMRWEKGLQHIKEEAPQIKILVLSAIEDTRVIKKAMSMGINGYISKRSDAKLLLATIKFILDGGIYLPEILLKKNSPSHEKEENMHILTKRQKQVLEYIAQGLSNKQIAFEMHITEATVKLHINALLKTLKATNRTQALIKAQEEKLI